MIITQARPGGTLRRGRSIKQESFKGKVDNCTWKFQDAQVTQTSPISNYKTELTVASTDQEKKL